MLVSRSLLIFSLVSASVLTGCSSTAPRNDFVSSSRPLPEPTLPNPELGQATELVPELPEPSAPVDSEVQLASAEEAPAAEPVVQVSLDENEDASAPTVDPAFGQIASDESGNEEQMSEETQTAAIAPAEVQEAVELTEQPAEEETVAEAAPEPDAEWTASQGRVPLWAASGWKNSDGQQDSEAAAEFEAPAKPEPSETAEVDLPPALPDFEAPFMDPEVAASDANADTEPAAETAETDAEWALPVAAEPQPEAEPTAAAASTEADGISHRMAILAYEVGNEPNPDQATLDTLRSLLEHENNHVRLNSAEALFKLGHGSEEALTVIQNTLSSSDENLAFLATIALGSVYQHSPGEALDLLLKQFVQNSEAVQRQAVLMVGEYQENRDELVPILTRVADKHPNAEVREAAVLSLSCLNRK